MYSLLKVFVKPLHRLFYHKIVVEGKENIPEGGVIFTPNHQNALMDALAVINTSGRNPYFLARADIFRIALYRALLTLLRTIPVYRKTDGTQSLDKNEEVFKKVSRLLAKNKSLVIFPEAGHNDKNRLQALRKGFVRVGFKAEEFVAFKQDIYIVPVGIFYTDFTRFRSVLHVRYGKPVSLKSYKELFEKSPQKAYNVVKSTVAKRIIPMMLNIKNQEYYQTFNRATQIYTERLLPQLGIGNNTESNLFRSRQKVVYLLNLILDRTPEQFRNIRLKLDDYFNELERLGYSHKSIGEGLNSKGRATHSVAFLVVSFPVFVYGFVHNILPYIIPKAIAKKAGDVHFISTYKFSLGVVFFTVFYALEIVGMSFLMSGELLALYGISLPVTGWVAYSWNRMRKRVLNILRLRKARRQQSGELYEMLRKHHEVIETLDEAVKPYF